MTVLLACFSSFASAEVVTSDSFKYADTLKVGNHTVAIVDKNDEKLLVVDGKPVLKIDSFQAFLNYSFKVGAEDLVLLSVSEGGNACPAMYQLVSVSEPKWHTKEFGTCSDIPKITVDTNKLTFVFKKMSGKGTETWIYENGKLSTKK